MQRRRAIWATTALLASAAIGGMGSQWGSASKANSVDQMAMAAKTPKAVSQSPEKSAVQKNTPSGKSRIVIVRKSQGPTAP